MLWSLTLSLMKSSGDVNDPMDESSALPAQVNAVLGGQDQLMGSLLSSPFCFFTAPSHLFVTSQWQPDPLKITCRYLIYRTIVSAFVLVNYVLFWATMEPTLSGLAFIYLTVQAITILTVQQILDLFLATHTYCHQPIEEPRAFLTRLEAFNWLLYTLISPSVLVIVILYWLAVYHPHLELGYFGIFGHGLSGAIVLADMVYTAKPIHWQHFFPSIIYGLFYSIFSLFYYVAGGKNKHGQPFLYPALDWRHPTRAITFCIMGMAVSSTT